jgi:hypothetical protein
MTKIFKSGLLILIVAAASQFACGRYSKVTELPKEEEMKKNERVYGDVGEPARQSKNTYPDDPDAAGKAVEIRKRIQEVN